MTGTHDLADGLKAKALELGFHLAGIAPLRRCGHGDFLLRWLSQGYHGEMAYMARTESLVKRLDPAALDPELRSALVVAHNYYYPATDSVSRPDPSNGVIARYARGRDYHRVIRRKLLRLLRWLESELGRPLPAARASVDTGPVLERELGRLAGLGWFGRNTMLIHPRHGSYFFLGVLFLELELKPDPPFTADHCGTCHACVEACPTGALLGRDEDGAPVMDAGRCISYLTIELRGAIPGELRPLLGNRVFGCDICQEVCPFTRKFAVPTSEPAYAPRGPGEPPFGVKPLRESSASHPGTASPGLIKLLETALDEAAWEAFSRGSPIRRAGRAGFARNVCVALGNWGAAEVVEGSRLVSGGEVAPSAVAVLVEALSDPEPLVRGHAAWALGRIGTAEARESLDARLGIEKDGSVRAELAAALGS